MTRIVRAQVAHTPRNPFVDEAALESFSDAAVRARWRPCSKPCESIEDALGGPFTLAREGAIAEVCVAGRVVG